MDIFWFPHEFRLSCWCQTCFYVLAVNYVLCKNQGHGAQLNILQCLPPVLISGIAVPVNQIPWVLRWMHWAYFQTYAFYNYIIVDFYWSSNKDATYCLTCVSPTYHQSLNNTIVQEGKYGQNIGIMVAYAVCARLLFTFILFVKGTLANV